MSRRSRTWTFQQHQVVWGLLYFHVNLPNCVLQHIGGIPPPSGRVEPPPVEAETPATVATVARTAAMNGDDHCFYSVSPKEKEARKQEVTDPQSHSYRIFK